MFATVFAMLVVAAPVPKDLKRVETNYFPTTVGARWVYRDSNGKETILTVAKVEKVKTSTHVTYAAKGGEIQVMSVSDKGLSQVNGAEAGLDAWVLELSHKPGDDWEVERKSGIEFRRMGKMEKVTVPAGTFEAIRVEVTRCLLSDSMRNTIEWYAPGVGVVKESTDSGAVIRELKSFRPGE
jgi:hypothetical protein